MPLNKTSQPSAQKREKKRQHRSFIRFVGSNITLIIIVVAYSIGGAYLFMLLEQYVELQNCQQATCKS